MRCRLARPALLAIVASLTLAGCGSAKIGSAAPPPPSALAGFPGQLPPATTLAYALHESTPTLTGARETLVVHRQWLALTRDRVAYVSCRAGTPAQSVGSVPAALAARWTGLIAGAHLGRTRSDPPDAQGRALWFADGRRLVRIDVARHLRRGPCTGAMCSAMLSLDSTLEAVLPASQAFNTFLAAHCPPA
jgi:hypothetical protein